MMKMKLILIWMMILVGSRSMALHKNVEKLDSTTEDLKLTYPIAISYPMAILFNYILLIVIGLLILIVWFLIWCYAELEDMVRILRSRF